MALLDAPVFVTGSPRDARWLEAGLTLLLRSRRDDGQHDHPPRLLELLSELHALADPTSRRQTPPNATDLVAPGGQVASMSVMETSQRLGVGGSMVRRRCDDGSLVAVKVGGKWRIHPVSVEQLEAK
jgi:excisionase family DNA binding protein